MGTVAYELREDFAGTTTVYDTEEDREAGNGREVDVYQGGSFALQDGSTFDVKGKLEEGDGVIVVDDAHAHLIDVLDARPELKRAKAPEGQAPISGYGHRTAADLRQELASRGLATGGNKDALIERLEANDRFVAEGDQEGASDPTPEDRQPETGGEE